jgi:hypothetical protein
LPLLGLTLLKGDIDVDENKKGKYWIANLTHDVITLGHRYYVGRIERWSSKKEKENKKPICRVSENPNKRIDWTKITINKELSVKMKDEVRKLILEHKSQLIMGIT